MQKNMNVRELIDRLEQISDNGSNDKLSVVYLDTDDQFCDITDTVINNGKIELVSKFYVDNTSLRSLINKLQNISNNGINDNMQVIYYEMDGTCKNVQDAIVNESWDIEII